MGKDTKAFHKPQTTLQAVLSELRRRLTEGELPPGTQIVQDTLAEQLGVSRAPIREALRILEGEGQISYSPHRGYFVAELDVDELVEIYRLRHILENEAITAAVPRLTVEDLARMAQAIEEMDTACREENIVALTAANRRFHFSLFAPSNMRRLVRILSQIWDASDQYRSLFFSDPKNRDLMQQEHAAIYRAAASGNLDMLLKMHNEHRTHAVPALKRAIHRE